MIKGTYFSKFLKLFLFGCGISCIMGLGNSVSAAAVQGFIQVGGDYIQSNLDNSFSNNVLKRGKLLAQYIGYTKPMFALGDSNLFFWNGNKPYLYDRYSLTDNCGTNVVQGYINNMMSCSVIPSGGGDWEMNCGNPVSYNEQLVSNFFQKVAAGDWSYYYRNLTNDYYCRTYTYDFMFCYSSSELNQSLCFSVSRAAYSDFVGLGESLQFPSDTSYSTINLSVLANPPGWGTSTPDSVYGSGRICPSVSEMLSQYDKKYTTGYCYVPVNESGTITNYFIEDIFSGFSNFQDMYSNYFAYCHAPITEEYCNSMLGNNMLGKSFIYKLSVSPYDFDLKTLRNYCHLTTLPLNATSCVLHSGGIAEPATPEELQNAIVDMPSTLVTPGENTIVSNVLGTGATDLSNINIIDTLNGLYSRFTSFFTEQSGYGGTLPTYIITFLLVIILFKLFKK